MSFVYDAVKQRVKQECEFSIFALTLRFMNYDFTSVFKI